MPGERRGGRERGTPNRRTVLADRILAVGSENSADLVPSFLLKLVKDQKLPADIRMAVVQKCFPAKGAHASRANKECAELSSTADPSSDYSMSASVQTKQDRNPVLDTFVGVVQDSNADAAARRKAALKIAEFLLPKIPKKAKLFPDEYGFAIDPRIAKRYRHLRRQLLLLKVGEKRNIPAVAQKIRELSAKVDKIRRRFPEPSPRKYGDMERTQDLNRLSELADLQGKDARLSEVETAEEAYLWARLDAFNHGPEGPVRRRLKELNSAE
jgi:hypothetical protein